MKNTSLSASMPQASRTGLDFFSTMLCVACGVLAPQPGVEPMPPALEVQSPNHWTTREVPGLDFEQILIRSLLTSGEKGKAVFEDKQVSNSLSISK